MLQTFRWKRCVAALPPLFLVVAACSDRSPVSPRADAARGTAENAPDFSRTSFASRGGRQSDYHLILVKDGAQAARILAKARALGGRIRHLNDRIGVLSVEGLSDQAAASLAADPDVEGIARDVAIRWLPPIKALRAAPDFKRAVQPRSDQSSAAAFGIQWNIQVIRANTAWLVTKQGKNALVCVLDTGIDPTHQDLEGKVDLSKSTSLVITEPEIEDFFFHGTAVASLIASNGIVMASVAPDARLCAVKVLDKTGSGTFDDVITGILFAADAGADVINMSFGALISTKDPGAKELIKALQRAVDFAHQRGVLAVAAAGNEALDFNTSPRDLRELPAQLNNVLSVGATAPINQQNFDMVASYSNFGSKGVDVFAPGGDFVQGSVLEDLILAACSSFSDPAVLGFDCTKDKHTYLFAAGTSFSTAHASGESAVIDAQNRGPEGTDQLLHCLEVGADAVTGRRFDPTYGFGRIDVLGGVNCRRIL
jgi:subtilisin family serine protease